MIQNLRLVSETLTRSLTTGRVSRRQFRPMQPTQGVSYPRSGHAIAYHFARLYFGEALVYCDTDNTSHCGCRSVPCINPERTFAKNHDFGVEHANGCSVIATERYLVQYRNPVRSIASNHYLFRQGSLFRRRQTAWRQFALQSVDYWNRFVDKWVLNFPQDAVLPLFCSYEDLILQAEDRIRDVLRFLSAEPLEEDAVAEILQARPIIRRDNLSSFKYYDAGFFREIEARTSGRLEKLGLPSFADGY